MSEEVWELLGYKGFCANEQWPQTSKSGDVEVVDLPIQINGKLKGLVSSKKSDEEKGVVRSEKKLPAVEKALKNKIIIKIIYIPGKILNIVVK